MYKAQMAICVFVPVLLLAADPWKDKKSSEWSAKDATRVLTNSPWAKTVSAEMNFSGMGGGPGGGRGSAGGMGGRAGGGPPGGGVGGPPGGGPAGGMSGPPEGGMEAPKFVVRWESATPVREAAAKLEDPHGSKISELAKEYYVISVSGTAMRPMGRPRQQEAGAPQPDFSRMQAGMIEATSLRVKGQESIAPAKVEVLQTAGAMTTLFLFPRSRGISTDSKEVTFETSMGPMVIKSKFEPKEMRFDGTLAL